MHCTRHGHGQAKVRFVSKMIPIQFASDGFGAIIGLVELQSSAWQRPDCMATVDLGGLAGDSMTRLVPKRTCC